MQTTQLDPRLLVHGLARTDLEVFLQLVFGLLSPGESLSYGWYLDAMVRSLEDVANGTNRRLQITVPPRHLKSITVNVAFPAWLMGRDPTFKVICASYAQDLAALHARAFRKVVTSQMYSEVFPETAVSLVRETDVDITTRQGGFRFATSLGGTVTGVGADLIVIDDLMKAADAAYPETRAKAKRFVDESLMSRLNDKKHGKVIAIQQRLHEDDISAHLTEKGSFRHLNLPAIAVQDEIFPLLRGRTHARRIGELLSPDREPQETLDEIRRDMGSRAFEAQYQQNPTPADGDYVKWDKIVTYEQAPERTRLRKVVHSWDCAASPAPGADYSVGTVWGFTGKAWLLLDVMRARLDYPDLLARVRSERARWQADVIIVEKASSGIGLLDDLARDMRGLNDPVHHAPNCLRIASTSRLPKAERLYTGMDRLYSGLAQFPREAPWLADLRREMMSFPNARYDDQVDSVSQFLQYAASSTQRQPIARR
ncbi:MAG: hypothetical protein EON87_07585 [Brevundimonas sp.]|nr:MAG: hypothetical protein EON87_07585 [Brevundimonas sp.]